MCGLRYLESYLYGQKFKVMGQMSAKEFYDLMLVLTLIIVSCVVVNKIFFIIANIVFRALDGKDKQKHTFNITKGDAKICKNNGKTKENMLHKSSREILSSH